MTMPKLKYFSASEFGLWWPFMNRDLLLALDAFREEWGSPVQISPVNGTLGRILYANEDGFESGHNLLRWGTVRAVDFFPRFEDGSYIATEAQRRRAYEIAINAGFEGIGLYTDTRPGNMMHGDMAGAGRRWARVPVAAGQNPYVSINQVV